MSNLSWYEDSSLKLNVWTIKKSNGFDVYCTHCFWFYTLRSSSHWNSCLIPCFIISEERDLSRFGSAFMAFCWYHSCSSTGTLSSMWLYGTCPLFFRGNDLLIYGFSIYCYSFSILTFEICCTLYWVRSSHFLSFLFSGDYRSLPCPISSNHDSCSI